MTLNHLKVFKTVAECGKMSEAAIILHVSQPAVSQVIRELEQHYGTRLLERMPKKLFLTETGAKLLLHADKVLASFENLEYEMSPEKCPARLRVGSSVTVGMCVMPGILKKFSAIAPQTEIYSYVNNTETIEKMLLNAELDTAIVEGKIKSREIEVRKLMDDFVVLFCSDSHRFAGFDEISLDEICCENFVMREKGSGTREIFEEFVKERRRKLKIKWEVACFDATLRAVREENCIGVSSVRLLAEHLKNGTVRAIYSPEHEWDRVFSLAFHKNKYMTEAAAIFTNMARKTKSEDLPAKEAMIRLTVQCKRTVCLSD